MIFYLIEFYGRKADMDYFLGGESILDYWRTNMAPNGPNVYIC